MRIRIVCKTPDSQTPGCFLIASGQDCQVFAVEGYGADEKLTPIDGVEAVSFKVEPPYENPARACIRILGAEIEADAVVDEPKGA